MHVGLVTQLLPPEFEGGTEAIVLAQARELAARGHRVDVVTGTEVPLPRGGAQVLHDLVGGVRVHRIPRDADERALDRAANPLEIRPRVRDLVLELLGGVDLVHLHHWANLDGSLVRALAPRAPVVVTLHDAFALCPRSFRHAPRGIACPTPVEVDAGPPGVLPLRHAPVRLPLEACASCLAPDARCSAETLLPVLDRRLGAFAAELAAARVVIAPSRHQAERFGWLALPGRLQVVPHGVSRALGRLAPAPRPAGDEPLVVAHFGNLSGDKGTLDLVRTLSLLPRERVELRLAGALLDPEVERAVAVHRRSNLVCLGPYDGPELEAFLAGSHLAAFPSRLDETYGLVVDEALALGLPAWVSDRGAPPERLAAWGMPGRVLPAGDPLAWAEALRAVLEAPHTVLEQRARVPEALPSAADAVCVLEAIYERVLDRGQDQGERSSGRGAA